MNEWQSLKRKKFFKVLFLCALFFLLASWNPFRIFYPARVLFGFLATPFEQAFSVAGFYTASWFDIFHSIGTLKSTNERLEQENIRLAAENAKLLDVQKENEFLRHELDLVPKKTFQLESADIIGQDMKNFGNWIMINKGSSDGIQKGMAVIVSQGVLVGRVEEALPGSSRVALITSPESVINGVDVQTEAKGIIKGQHGLGMVFDMVLQSDSLKVGDDIIASGLGGDVPHGLAIGKISDITPSSDRLFQQATIASSVNLSKLRTVSVITGTH